MTSSNQWIAVAAAAALATGCTAPGKVEQQCPAVSVLVDTSTIPVTRSATATNAADLVYTAQIVQATRDCTLHDYAKQVEASVNIDFRATRPRAGDAVAYKVPYFVAITTEGKVLAKREFWVQFSFDQGAKVAEFSDAVNSMVFTPARDKQAADYGILVGFQLTKSQLEFNRKVGRYAP